ncbi:MAG: hypothetical protein Salg2KO_22950 [Salibacteraceae bacterium]
MANPDSGIANQTINVSIRTQGKTSGDSEVREIAQVETDANGAFYFEYNRGNKRQGKKRCQGFCSRPCDGLIFQWGQERIAECIPNNEDLVLPFFLSNTVELILEYTDTINAGDAVFFTMAPIDTTHPNYFRPSANQPAVFRIVGPVNGDFRVEYTTEMTHANYIGWNGGARARSAYHVSNNYNEAELFFEELPFINPQSTRIFSGGIEVDYNVKSFKGVPYTDQLTLP